MTGPTRHPTLPDAPTMQEAGLAGFSVVTWNVLQGPRGIPAPIAERLNRAMVEAMSEPVLRQRLATAGIDPAEPSTPASTRAFVAAEVEKFRTAKASRCRRG